MPNSLPARSISRTFVAVTLRLLTLNMDWEILACACIGGEPESAGPEARLMLATRPSATDLGIDAGRCCRRISSAALFGAGCEDILGLGGVRPSWNGCRIVEPRRHALGKAKVGSARQ